VIVHLTIRRSITGVLTQAVTEMTAAAAGTAGAATEIATSSQALSQGASEQAASLEEVSATGEEISAMTNKNADNSRHAADSKRLVNRRCGWCCIRAIGGLLKLGWGKSPVSSCGEAIQLAG
jgi:hypothetical protein